MIPRCDGLVHRLYAVQDFLCYCVTHRTDKKQVSLKNCSKCLYIIDFATIYIHLEYNIQVLTIEMTGGKPLCIRVQITAVTSKFYFMMVVVCVIF